MKNKQPNSRDCFACGMQNPIGLKLQFYQIAPDEVTAELTPTEEYQGYDGILHGGVIATIMDEAVSRAHMGVDPYATNFVYTAELTVKYKQKIPIGKPIRVVGKQGKRMRWAMESKGYIYAEDGTLLAEAKAILVDMPEKISPEEIDEFGWKVYPD
jgi:acyl-coenzyme A thioesterase PaaI-like protein